VLCRLNGSSAANEMSVQNLVALPILFGLIGFVEPCSIGSTLVMIKQIEQRAPGQQIAQTVVFALTRALFIGGAGLSAIALGSVFLGLQKAAWLFLGVVYIALGMLYMRGKAGLLMRSFGPRISRLQSTRGSVMLGLLFGLNIPACAAPLLFALLGAVAAGGTGGATLVSGFVSLALFGLALSLPLVLAVFFAPARRALGRLATLSRRMPFWTGVLFVALGAWSVWFGLFVSLEQ
jgi:cytochrome c-type biogenesis protein